jgi:hypothetical protein
MTTTAAAATSLPTDGQDNTPHSCGVCDTFAPEVVARNICPNA